MHKISLFVLFYFGALLVTSVAQAEIYIDTHSGYLDTVNEERYSPTVEVQLQIKEVDEGPALQDMIFTHELSKEFKNRYQDRFGYTDSEQLIQPINKFSITLYPSAEGVAAVDDIERRREFGNYILKRLTEHHVDSYFKTSPNMRTVYEVKEKLSNIKLEVKKGYKLAMRYSYSSNELDLDMSNPFEIENRVTLQMNPNSFGPSEVQEAILHVWYNFPNAITLGSHYKTQDGVFSLTGEKVLSKNLSTSLSGFTYFKDEGVSEREHKVILGFSWSS